MHVSYIYSHICICLSRSKDAIGAFGERPKAALDAQRAKSSKRSTVDTAETEIRAKKSNKIRKNKQEDEQRTKRHHHKFAVEAEYYVLRGGILIVHRTSIVIDDSL